MFDNNLVLNNVKSNIIEPMISERIKRESWVSSSNPKTIFNKKRLI